MRSAPFPFLAALVAIVFALTGCSLITIESVETPLSQREMNARVTTHRFVEHFIGEVRDTADRIAEGADEEEVLLDAIRWKIGATAAITVTGFQTSPRDGLVDSWAYCAQMAAFFRDGAGREMFGGQHALALTKSAELEEKMGRLARRFAPVEDASRWQEFVNAYVASTPLSGLAAPRQSSVFAFYEFMGIDEEEAIETVGALSQVVNDFSSRMGVMGDQLPQETAWRSELFLREQGVGGGSMQEQLALLSARMERMAIVAEETPALVDATLLSLQEEVATLIDAIAAERGAAMEGLGREREAAMEALAREREIVIEAFSKERVATMAEGQVYLNELVEKVFSQISGVAGIVVFGLCLLVVILFGVPFGAGVLVGRLSTRRVAPARSGPR
jgi:hypothetical protein